jgi:hypothetical protein
MYIPYYYIAQGEIKDQMSRNMIIIPRLQRKTLVLKRRNVIFLYCLVLKLYDYYSFPYLLFYSITAFHKRIKPVLFFYLFLYLGEVSKLSIFTYLNIYVPMIPRILLLKAPAGDKSS